MTYFKAVDGDNLAFLARPEYFLWRYIDLNFQSLTTPATISITATSLQDMPPTTRATTTSNGRPPTSSTQGLTWVSLTAGWS